MSDVKDSIPIHGNDEEAARMENNIRIIERFERPRFVTERKSDNPFAAVWRELQRYAGDDAARRALTTRGIVDEDRLKSLRNQVRLGDSYYLAYRDADEIIDPVLLYYGAFALAKAICYGTLDEDGLTLWKKRPTHGISSKIGTSLLDSNIFFQENGTAQAFAYTLGGDAPRECTMKASDLFRGIPELDTILHDIGLGGTSAMPIAHSGDVNEVTALIHRFQENIHVVANEGYTSHDFEREIPLAWALMNRGVLFQMDIRQVSWKKTVGGEAELLFMAMRTSAGMFFERRMPGGFYIPELALHLILLHLLADYARYRPNEWIEMIDSHNDQYALVREFIHISEYKFPNLILNELAWKTFIFSHS